MFSWWSEKPASLLTDLFLLQYLPQDQHIPVAANVDLVFLEAANASGMKRCNAGQGENSVFIPSVTLCCVFEKHKTSSLWTE